MKKCLALLLLLLHMAWTSAALAQIEVPPAPVSSRYVQDYAGVLSQATKDHINDLGSRLDAKTKAQLVVVTVTSLHGVPPEEYALAILRQWGVGGKQLNNGVVLLVAVNDKKSRLEVGYGLEGALPDAKTGALQDQYMLPYFRQGNFDGGIANGYVALVGEVIKEYQVDLKADSADTQQPSSRDTVPWWMKLLMALIVLGLLLTDWIVFGGTFTFLILSLFRGGRGGNRGGDDGSFGGGSGGGGGSNRSW